MTDPRRWLDPESDARVFEREVLELAKPVSIPAASRDRVWQRVAMLNQPPVGTGETGASGGGGGATAGSSAGGLGVIKLFVVGALAGLAFTGGGYAVIRRRSVERRLTLRSSRSPRPGAVASAPLAGSATPSARPLAAPDAIPVPKTAPLPRKVAPASVTSSAPLETEQHLRRRAPWRTRRATDCAGESASGRSRPHPRGSSAAASRRSRRRVRDAWKRPELGFLERSWRKSARL